MPPGVVHGFDNDGPGELRFLNFHAPGCGFAEYLRGRDDDFDQHPPPRRRRPAGLRRAGRAARRAASASSGQDRAITILGELPEISVFRLEVEPDWPGIGTHHHSTTRWTRFFVLEGEAELVVGDDVVRAGPGSFYAAPPGALHGVRQRPGSRAVFLNVHGPDAGFAESDRGRQ